MEEEWKEIEGWNGIYYISSLGRVKRENKMITITPNKNRHGYCYVDLKVKGIRKNSLLHRLVALHFIPNPANKPCVNHLDFNVSNNEVSNLEWATHKENSAYTMRAGRISRSRGEDGGNSKLKLETVRKIRKDLAKGIYTHTQIAGKYKTNYSNVAHIKRGSRWSYSF